MWTRLHFWDIQSAEFDFGVITYKHKAKIIVYIKTKWLIVNKMQINVYDLIQFKACEILNFCYTIFILLNVQSRKYIDTVNNTMGN